MRRVEVGIIGRPSREVIFGQNYRRLQEGLENINPLIHLSPKEQLRRKTLWTQSFLERKNSYIPASFESRVLVYPRGENTYMAEQELVSTDISAFMMGFVQREYRVVGSKLLGYRFNLYTILIVAEDPSKSDKYTALMQDFLSSHNEIVTGSFDSLHLPKLLGMQILSLSALVDAKRDGA